MESKSEHDQYGTLSVFELDKLPSQWSDQVSDGSLLCREIGQADAEAMEQLMHATGTYPVGDVQSRLHAGRIGYVGELIEPALARSAKEEGKSAEPASKAPTKGLRMVSYGWVALEAEPLGESGIAFLPPPGDAYLYDFATYPQYRGHGYYPALLRFILTDLRSHAIKRAWIGTAPGNGKSARSIWRAGFQKVGEATIVRDLNQATPRFELRPGSGEVSHELLEIARQTYIALKK